MMKEGNGMIYLFVKTCIKLKQGIGPIDTYLQINLVDQLCLECQMSFEDWSLSGILHADIYD